MTMFDPYREFQSLRREVDRAFANDGFGALPAMRMAFLPGRAARQYPLFNLYDDGDRLYVEALVPGVAPDEMEVSVKENVLTIAGMKPGFGDIPPERIHRNERAAGRFIRTISLPAEVDRDRVDAQYRNGLLLLTMPRSEESKPKRVMIHHNGQQTNGHQQDQVGASDQGGSQS